MAVEELSPVFLYWTSVDAVENGAAHLQHATPVNMGPLAPFFLDALDEYDIPVREALSPDMPPSNLTPPGRYPPSEPRWDTRRPPRSGNGGSKAELTWASILVYTRTVRTGPRVASYGASEGYRHEDGY